MNHLAGKHNAKFRQAIMQIITGIKLPIARCGVNNIERGLFEVAEITDFTCQRDKEDQFYNWLQS